MNYATFPQPLCINKNVGKLCEIHSPLKSAWTEFGPQKLEQMNIHAKEICWRAFANIISSKKNAEYYNYIFFLISDSLS